MSEEIVGCDELQENLVYIELDNFQSNFVFDWFKERERAIGCAFNCALRDKVLVHKQILFGDKEEV